MRVLVADQLSDAGVAALAAHFDVDVRTGLGKPALVEAIPDYDAVVVRSATRIDADVIAAGRRLRVIARAGIGLDNVDVRAATARGVLVCNAPQSNVISAAEHTVALLLALARTIPRADRSLREGRWDRSAFQGVELQGKRLGVLGLGRVGTLVTQRFQAFGMRVTAYDPYVSEERATQLGVDLVATVGELCAVADVLTVHLPKTPETEGIVGEAELRALPPNALVVNTARGGLIDEAALERALQDGTVAGAALDVFSTEPMTDSPLFALDNVVVTPTSARPRPRRRTRRAPWSPRPSSPRCRATSSPPRSTCRSARGCRRRSSRSCRWRRSSAGCSRRCTPARPPSSPSSTWAGSRGTTPPP